MHPLARHQRRLPDPWHETLRTRPGLPETFCETPRSHEIRHSAANWIRPGQPQGRGKPGICRKHKLAAKNIFMKPPGPLWKIILNRRRRNRTSSTARMLTVSNIFFDRTVLTAVPYERILRLLHAAG